ncbi:MAG: heavy metal translocating P-type ATPase [Clostridia bacterium]|nr:heavy metal translocating P-type ATPase [Clostridia bacterium]
MKEEIYIISGMSCAACSSAVERVTRKIDGVERSDVNLTTGKMTIVYDETKVKPKLIKEKVKKAGFGIRADNDDQRTTDGIDGEKNNSQRNELICAVIITLLLLYVSMGQMFKYKLPVPEIIDMNRMPENYALTQILLTIPILYFGRRFFINGFKALFHRNPNMDSLVAIGSGSSFLYSLYLTYLIPYEPHHVHHLYYESAAVVITFIMLGKFLESRNKEKTKGAIKKLMELAPDTALLVKDDMVTEVASESLKPGDIVLVKPGAKIPLDGIVKSGSGGVDESMLTGESLPVEKSEGSEVIGGSISYNGALYVEITRIGEDTTLSKIIKFVEDAQGKKAPISKIADKVAGIFVPSVIGIAVLASVIWTIAGKDFSFVLRIFTSVLVIACPCALGLATPTAIMVGTGLGASNGILIRSGEALEITHNINVVVLDKTGTVTEGKPVVTEIISNGISEEELLQYAAAVEASSDHPLAKAIVERAGVITKQVTEFENVSGMGIRAAADGKRIAVGNKRLMDGVDVSEFESDIKRLSEQGETPMYVAINSKLMGIISVADSVKETSREAVSKLKKAGIKVYLLTGDNKAAAEHIGRLVGADEVISEVLPEDKAEVVKKLQAEGNKVMMVGDGINDAPALVQADVGAAVGGGSDIAIESADIVLMKSDLNDVYKAIRLSRMTIKNVKENLFWAFCYNTIGIPIAAGILYPFNGMLLSPMFAGLAMSLSSVCVVSNALRLRSKKL